ncbi:hypothetical protein DWQ65_08765 [Treponema phagedenis]|uniref:Uncharacterized protein n=1 Tax=Treponema phagedenis TaxID=162 RepID=A0AAE6IVX8_TREPH|nr:hypothetical protein FUT79_02610 [Treponema phagedenis]QEJ99201.1 hypothetical protein FUT82_15205 [Treponema phagedenis]QEK04768.1 hypothetical protein FUT83_13825 [Treponema phagedenis]QEK10388.1 hypothetical protein FUT81_13740 [Treponema phagedenis]QSH95163.1 hypothetical protein C5O78_08985 [Treponema phagedenis]
MPLRAALSYNNLQTAALRVGLLRAPLSLRLFCGGNCRRKMIRLRNFEKLLRRPPYASRMLSIVRPCTMLNNGRSFDISLLTSPASISDSSVAFCN